MKATSDRFDERALLTEAENATGLHDWGNDDTFRIGLGVFLDALADVELPPQLDEMVHGHVLMLLTQRLGMVDDATRHPEILDIPVERPLIVLGMPRTGTTILYDLLAQSPDTRSPLAWEASNAWPAPGAQARWESDPRIADVQAQVDGLLSAAPEIGAMLPVGATLPAECNRLMMYHFAGPEFGAHYAVPAHTRWVATERVPGLYRTHRRVLQQLAWKGPRGRWVLKSPIHLYDLEGLLAEYPDASLVWTHRDPVQVFTSLSALIVALRKAMGFTPDRRAVATEVLDAYGALLVRGMASREDPAIDSRILDVPFRDTVSDPVGTVRTVHEHFGFDLTDEHTGLIGQFLRDHPRGNNPQRSEGCGYDPAVFRQRFAAYYDRFGDLI
jgi:hypothetical protein